MSDVTEAAVALRKAGRWLRRAADALEASEPEPEPEPSPGWERPIGWDSFPVYEVYADTPRWINFVEGQDWVVRFAEPRSESLEIRGGRTVVVLGGEFLIPEWTEEPDIHANDGLAMREMGTAWVEGLKVHGKGVGDALRFVDCGDGYAINCHLEGWIKGQNMHDGGPPYTRPHHSDPIQNLGADVITIAGCHLKGNIHGAYLNDDLHHKTADLLIEYTQITGVQTPDEDGGTIQPASLLWFGDCDPVNFGPEVYAVFPPGGAWGDSFELATQPRGTLEEDGSITWPGVALGRMLPGTGPARATTAGMNYGG